MNPRATISRRKSDFSCALTKRSPPGMLAAGAASCNTLARVAQIGDAAAADGMTSKDRLLALGLMSGTSCDGVDAALVETDGREAITCGPWLSEPYDAAFHDRLRSVLGGRGDIAAVERELTERHAHAVRDLLTRRGIAASTVDVVGFHGQTDSARARARPDLADRGWPAAGAAHGDRCGE